jgi:hypothetical protein
VPETGRQQRQGNELVLRRQSGLRQGGALRGSGRTVDDVRDLASANDICSDPCSVSAANASMRAAPLFAIRTLSYVRKFYIMYSSGKV